MPRCRHCFPAAHVAAAGFPSQMSRPSLVEARVPPRLSPSVTAPSPCTPRDVTMRHPVRMSMLVHGKSCRLSPSSCRRTSAGTPGPHAQTKHPKPTNTPATIHASGANDGQRFMRASPPPHRFPPKRRPVRSVSGPRLLQRRRCSHHAGRRDPGEPGVSMRGTRNARDVHPARGGAAGDRVRRYDEYLVLVARCVTDTTPSRLGVFGGDGRRGLGVSCRLVRLHRSAGASTSEACMP